MTEQGIPMKDHLITMAVLALMAVMCGAVWLDIRIGLGLMVALAGGAFYCMVFELVRTVRGTSPYGYH